MERLEFKDLKSDILIDAYCDASKSEKVSFLIDLKMQSKQLGVSKQDIDSLFKGYELDYKEALKQQSKEYKLKSKEINFQDLALTEDYIDYAGNYYSGSWSVNNAGQIVKPIVNPNSFETELVAC